MDALEYWMSELSNKSDATREKYDLYFHRFTDWLGETSSQILENRKADLKLEDIVSQRRYESKLKAYVAFLSKSGKSTSTQQVVYAAVSSFFEMNYMPLRMRKGDYPSGDNLGYRAATRDDILQLLEADDDPRLRAMVLFLKDSGLRVSDLVGLTYGDVRKHLEAGEEFIPINLITKKNSIATKTAIGPEAVQALRLYLDHRREGTEEISPEVLKDDAPLFRARTKDVRFLNRSSVSSAMNYLVSRAGLSGDISAHSFRKFTETRLEAAGVHGNWIDQLLGHRLPGTRQNYSRPVNEELLEAYKKAYDALRVHEVPATAAAVEKNELALRKAMEEIRELKTDLALALSRERSTSDKYTDLEKQLEDQKIVIAELAEAVRQLGKKKME